MAENSSFNFEDYDPKSMLEYRACELLNRYMDDFEPDDKIEALQIVEQWAKKYPDEIMGRAR